MSRHSSTCSQEHTLWPDEDLVDFTVLSLLVSICREPKSVAGGEERQCRNNNNKHTCMYLSDMSICGMVKVRCATVTVPWESEIWHISCMRGDMALKYVRSTIALLQCFQASRVYVCTYIRTYVCMCAPLRPVFGRVCPRLSVGARMKLSHFVNPVQQWRPA